ncbi:hypothetical protein [Paulownia witches'-broom phytoplasma]|uniref:hypothetical protein n=1 Tax=Paulownia witches'-broom phytoplasma TaxID=39647 RepID=UPI001CED4B6E|nr:hypothetical protein [Paulownia witches'-broom phytoplasma]GLH61045.1 hypothetical protein PAWBP_7830 [Paulownia witches'-broom phytoplasma]
MEQTVNIFFRYRFDQNLTDISSFKTIKGFKQFLEKVISPLNKYIEYTWYQIKKTHNKGPRYHVVQPSTLSRKGFARVVNLSEDELIFQISLNLQERVYGITVGEYFVIIAYDPNHKGNTKKK